MYKKYIIILAIVISCVLPVHQAKANLPVIDFSNLATAIVTFLKDSASYVEDTIQTAQGELSNINEEIELIGQIEEIAHQVEQIANQVSMIKNQGTAIANQIEQITRFDNMLEDWAKQLAKLESGDLEGFLDNMATDLETMKSITDNSRGIMSEWENPDAEFDTIFDTMDSEDPLDNAAIAAKRKVWNKEMVYSSYDSVKTLEMLDNTRDVDETAAAVAKMDAAEGDVGVMQAKAGLDVVLIRQNSELKYLMAAMNQKNGMETARQAAERDQADKKSKAFLDEYDTFTEYEVTPFQIPSN